MNLATQIAKQLRDVYSGGNWTASNLKDNLKDVSWQQATAKLSSLNTIADLVFHTGYFISAVLTVLEKGVLEAKDKYSFDYPAIESEEDWEKFLDKNFEDAEKLAKAIEVLPESILHQTFVEEKYGNYYRNFSGVIEHVHYHLGQIVIIKKLLTHT